MAQLDIWNWSVDPFVGVGPIRLGATAATLAGSLGKPSAEGRSTRGVLESQTYLITGQPGTTGKVTLKLTFDGAGTVQSVSFDHCRAFRVAGEPQDFDGLRTAAEAGSPAAKKLIKGLYAYPAWGITLFSEPGKAGAEPVRRLNVKSRTSFSELVFDRSAPVPPPPPPERAGPARTYAEVLKLVRTLEPLQDLARDTWLVTAEKGDAPLAGSRYGGLPWLKTGERTPACRNCKAPLPLVLQLSSADLPEGVGALFRGLLQYFRCQNPNCLEVDDKTAVVRLISPADLTGSGAGLGGTGRALPTYRITGWQVEVDYPDVASEEAGHPARQAVESIPSGLRDYHAHFPRHEDKLRGWPSWIQDAEAPACRKCRNDEHVRFILQVGTSGWTPPFGDMGCEYLFQCGKHPEEWQVVGQSH